MASIAFDAHLARRASIMNQELHPNRRAEICASAIDALLDLPKSIGRYEVRGELGRGGMGVVYDGFDASLTRAVAIKLIDEKLLADTGLMGDELEQRFEREMRATSRLFHPNLVAILDAGFATVRDTSRAYYVMERIEGECLDSRLRRTGPMLRKEGLEVAAAVARGLAAVHGEGLVHRDIKPSNILIPLRGEAKLTDFGLCQWQLDSVGAGEAKGITGSPHYLAPEQVTQGEVDFKADLFSLGAVLVHIFSGAPPFPATSLSAHLGRIITDDPDGLAVMDRDVRGLASELLSKNPKQRPESAEAVAQRLEEMARNSRSHAPLWQVLRKVAIATGVLTSAAVLLGAWAGQDLAQLQAQTQLRKQELEIQLDRARAVVPTLSFASKSGDRYASFDPAQQRDEAIGTLNRIAVERRRYQEAASQLDARLEALPWSLFAFLIEDPAAPILTGAEARDASRVYDPDSFLSAREVSELEQQLNLLKEEFEVETQVLFVTPPPQQSLASVGIDWFEQPTAKGLGLGERGLLLLVDGKSRRARVEVGYGLEPYLTDALAGALARQHLAPSMDAAAPGLELRIILRIVRQRLRNASLAGSFVLPESNAPSAKYVAGGGGASAVTDLAGAKSASVSRHEAQVRYAPAATVREVYQRYLHWLRHGESDAAVGLFTPASRTLVEAWQGTKVYFKQMSSSPVIGRVEIIEEGEHAMLFALDDPLAPPHFFIHDTEGWRIDLAARERHVIAIAGGSFSWTLNQISDLPLSEFHDQLEIVDGLIRMQGGDNRSLAAIQAASLSVMDAPRS
jgi:serine/threonine protein kinase